MNILIAEDEKDIRDLISIHMKKENYNIFEASNGEEALEIFKREKIDLILLDIMMPKINGISVIQKIREVSTIPIICITAMGNDCDKVLALGLGADDYVVKPFLPKELTFRIMAILRRSYKDENPLIKLQNSEIDFDRAELIKGGEHIALTAKEHDILAVLYRNAGRIVTIDALCEAAWGENPFGYENSLMAHIRRIREKIELNPSRPVSLITVKGLGYKLIVGGK